MTQADSVYSTPPTNTPVDTTRRHFLTVATGASVGTLAALASMPALASPPDPIFAVIDRHRKACAVHNEALDTHCAFEEVGMQGEKREQYNRLRAATDAAYDELESMGLELINTLPTTLAGILALCRYMQALFGDTDQPDLPECISYDDDTSAYPAEAFAYVIGRSIEKMMKTEGMV
jgi:hypothetical protein